MHLSKLKKGDKIIIVAPSGKVDTEKLNKGIEILESWGLKVLMGKYVFSDDPCFAASEEKRLYDLQQALNNNEIKAIFCARGGYGISQIIDKIDFTLFLKYPKWVIGYSDITLLLSKIQSLGIPCIHAPMPATFYKYTDQTLELLYKLLFEGEYSISLSRQQLIFLKENKKKFLYEITGGNLCLLQATIGTPFQVNFANKVLFIEEIDEPAYKIERMLYHLYHAGVFKNLQGIIIGNLDIQQNNHFYNINIEDFFLKRYRFNVGFILNNFPAGHGNYNFPIPMGIPVRMQINNDEIKFYFNI